ncbi:MAG: tRNA pseudouridine(55) synthase TruB [Ignavibacteria bacterium]|nr:tRNA pseudouridine(55) synthase TruB [Ignavibacteria bacterium]
MQNIIDELSRCGFYGDEEGKIFLVGKPTRWSSFDVCKKIRTILREKKVGHCGTLDPHAEGLLIVFTAKKTKFVEKFSALEKEYIGEMILGARTQSFDLEKEIQPQSSAENISGAKIVETFSLFLGTQQQVPPMFSAAKVDGKRLYQYAREGMNIERKPRTIVVSKFEATDIDIPSVKFQIVCSKGTYIRTLVDDVGLRLGCGAYMKSLKRTRIGNLRLENALSLEQISQHFSRNQSFGPFKIAA